MMKTHTISLRHRLGRALAASERYFGPLPGSRAPQRASVYQEMRLGAAIGLLASLVYAGAAGASGPALLFAVVLGFCAGAVIGLVLWSSSSDLPADPVLPPARGQERQPWHAALGLGPGGLGLARAACKGAKR